MSRMGTFAIEQIQAPSMDPQPFCAICGKAPGGANKTRIVDGVRLEYPEGIDAHHPFGRPGPVVYIGHDCCHTPHHDGRVRLEFLYDGVQWRFYTPLQPTLQTCRIAPEWDR